MDKGEKQLEEECSQMGILYEPPKLNETIDSRLQRIQGMKKGISKKKYQAKRITSKMDKQEQKLQEECSKLGIDNQPHANCEGADDKKQRIQEMKRKVNNNIYQDKNNVFRMDQEDQQLKENCSKVGISYEPPVDSESTEHKKERIQRTKRKIANKTFRDKKKEDKTKHQYSQMGLNHQSTRQCETADNKKDGIEGQKSKHRNKKFQTTNKRQKKSGGSSESHNQQSTQPNPLRDVHPNPEVFSSMVGFENGEEKHYVATCIACRETRPVFHASYDNKTSHVNLNSWTVDKNSLCKRCKTDRSSRYKKKNGLPNKFSGHLSKEDDLGPITDQLRHNNQHFLPVPPYLKNLTSVELALVSKVTVCMQVHMLRYGMMSSKGHSISIPQRMAIARQLPQLPENVGIVVLIRKGAKDSTKSYTVQRSAVENALIGLCYGSPCGGFEDKKPGTSCYTGPDHINKALKGRYFDHFPNQYYADVEILNGRLMTLPMVREQFPQQKVVEMKKDITEEDKGPSPSQFEVPSSPNDESVTTSGITLPVKPKDADLELQGILDKLVGNERRAAVVNWEYADDEPLSELKTPGVFAMSFPSVFVNGSCDITHNPLVKLDYNAWVQHIYFTGDGRVPNHPFLKFFLYNLSLRKQALQQGNFLVAQQLNESHLSLCELQEKLQNNDDSIPRKIIKMGGNLVDTDPYWMNRRRELEALTFYRRKEVNDLPAYFTTNSMAELHWAPLINLLAKYLSVTSDTEETVIHDKLSNDISYLRRRILENLHIVTQYFDARTKNYYHIVIKELFQCDDFYYRYEFAKSRGQIHAHGILFSKKHAKKVEEALETNNIDKSNEDRAKYLYNWLQTTDLNDDHTYSPLFTSMHPAGGKQVTDELGQTTWNPNKDGWPESEGFHNPPEFNPLRQKVSECL